MVKLGLDEAQQSIADALDQFCADHCPDAVLKAQAGRFPAELWKGVAELGVLALATPEGDGGPRELVAAMEALGRGVFPGPLAATFLATQVLPEVERRAVAAGTAIASVGTPPLLPWAPVAQLFVELDGGRAFLATPRGGIEPVDTLGGEPWGRVELERTAELGSAEHGLALHDLALAAWLAAAGERLVRATAEHARNRRQFGRAIGEFQAVAHPLADRLMELTAAATLARAAACDESRATAAAARLSAARAAVAASHTAHQLFGAIGITLEGEVFHVSRRIRQLASQPPSEEAAARDAVLAAYGL